MKQLIAPQHGIFTLRLLTKLWDTAVWVYDSLSAAACSCYFCSVFPLKSVTATNWSFTAYINISKHCLTLKTQGGAFFRSVVPNLFRNFQTLKVHFFSLSSRTHARGGAANEFFPALKLHFFSIEQNSQPEGGCNRKFVGLRRPNNLLYTPLKHIHYFILFFFQQGSAGHFQPLRGPRFGNPCFRSLDRNW